MKKLALTFTIVLGLSLCSYAQMGGLFGYGQEEIEEENYSSTWYAFGQDNDYDNSLFGIFRGGVLTPNLPNHGEDDNVDAPLGGGALLLIGFGSAYALKKRSKK